MHNSLTPQAVQKCVDFAHSLWVQKMVSKEGCIAGTGFILLLGWVAVFVNILATQKVEPSADWHKRFDPFSTSDGPVYNDDDHLLVLATSLMSTDVGNGGAYDA